MSYDAGEKTRSIAWFTVMTAMGAMLLVATWMMYHLWRDGHPAPSVGTEVTQAAVAPVVTEVATPTIPPIEVPVDVYDRSLGKVVVSVGVFTDDLLVSSAIRDDGEPDSLALCIKGSAVSIETVEEASPGLVLPMQRVDYPDIDLSCVGSGRHPMKNERLTARIANKTGKEQAVLVVAGLVRAHNALRDPGRGAENSYWDCDTRRGTKAEGMEGSVVGLWPRPVQDCSPITFSGFGRIEDNDCPPPCP